MGSRLCCPYCDEHFVLNDDNECDICEGHYKMTWIKKDANCTKDEVKDGD